MRLTATLSLLAALAGCATLDGDEAYRIPSSAMEPTLHCGKPDPGCEGETDDRVIAESVDPDELRRGDIVVFETPPAVRVYCGIGGTFVKRLIGLPGEQVELRIERGSGYVHIDGRKLDEPYIETERRDNRYEKTFYLRAGEYLVMGDNRSQSCDSREWGPLRGDAIHHRVVRIERPSGTIDLR